MKTTYQNAEITMSDLSILVSFESSNCYKVVFYLRMSFNASNVILVCRIDVKHQYTIQAVCVYFVNDRGKSLLEHVH